MEILLLQNVPNVGKKGDILNVKDGLASNMLLPKGLAKRVTPQDKKRLEAQNKKEEAKRQELIEKRHEIADELRNAEFVFKIKGNGKGKIHGHVGEKEIISEIKKKFGYELTKKNIDMGKDGHFKKAGKRDVFIKMQGEIVSKLSVEIVEI